MDIAATERLRSAAEEVVEQHQAHVIDFLVRGDRGRRVIELYIDSRTGVSLDLCSTVSRALMTLISEKEMVDGDYRMEVSSPGIARPLRFPWQYTKHIGRRLQVRRRDAGEVVQQTGELVSADDEAITLRMGKEGGEARIPFADLIEATVKAPW